MTDDVDPRTNGGSTERSARLRHIFDDWAKRGRAEGMEEGHGFAARHAFEALGLEPGARYLDIGCGNGYTVRWAARVVGDRGHAAGLDLSPRMVERARAASEGLGNVSFHHTVFPDHPFPHESFGAVFSMETFYYLPDLEGALAEVRRLLVPGGRFACVVDYYEENLESHSWPEELGCEMRLLDMAGWRKVMEQAGLEVTDQGLVLRPLAEGQTPTWKHTQGSLLTLVTHPGA